MQLFHLIFFSLCICLFTKLGECFCINTLDTDGQSWQALRFFQGEKKSSLSGQFSEYSQTLTEMFLLSFCYFQAPSICRLMMFVFSWFFLAGSHCNCFSFCKAWGSLSCSFKPSFIMSWMLSHSVSCTIISSLKNKPQFPFLDTKTLCQCQHWHSSCWEISQYLGFWEMSIRYCKDEICEFTETAAKIPFSRTWQQKAFFTVQNLCLDRINVLSFRVFFSSSYEQHGVFLCLLGIPEYTPAFIIRPKQTLPSL